MLVSLGRTPRREGLVDLLLACHARIRSFSAMAERLGDAALDDALGRMRDEHADHAAALRDLLIRCEALRASDRARPRRA